ncbi:hypothetical protein AMTR_s04495p00003530 [Amborella trichopoda]|uniref:Uncharacterized protein n=1 Tax=Amborella trichopoda TaxID=13333 RepID=U5D0S6_AMBTC|nr:hypothetical protein AMTR_s04495p00003530 [Amborella trichopoda]
MRVVSYHGVGSQVLMDSFFVTEVDPKAIMYQNEKAVGKLFFCPLSRTSRRTPFYLSLITNNKNGVAPQLYTPFVLRLLILNFVREGKRALPENELFSSGR